MPLTTSVQNSFIGGLKTEFTGLNFPENACTACSNCVFSIIGDVTRRLGINYEMPSYTLTGVGYGSQAQSKFRWKNAGGDGQTELLVWQIGNNLYFYSTSAAGVNGTGVSQQFVSVVNFIDFRAINNNANVSLVECQFSAGNGYLFVCHPDCDPFYCTYSAGAVTANLITLQIRDFIGVNPEPGNPPITFRSTTLTNEHNYNLQNQGWVGVPPWSAQGSQVGFIAIIDPTQLGLNGGANAFTVPAGLTGTSPGQTITFFWNGTVDLIAPNGNAGLYGASGQATGVLVSYSGTTMVLNISANTQPYNVPSGYHYTGFIGAVNFAIQPGTIQNTISTFNSATGFYPSNADIWYEYKDSTGIFNPTVTYTSVSVGSGQAPQGHFILNAFLQQRSILSGIAGLTDITTSARPRTGCWFAGRVWYAGVDASQAATGDEPFYTWTENIYFSTIISTTSDFGTCYQTNDPTDETLFNELPTDGGVIVIPGSGAIYKLFPIQNGLIVFAANGNWLIRGNTGLGFTATDYSVNKISPIKSISGSSFIDVLGLPIFWNEEGIYAVEPSKENAPYGFGGLTVNPLTVGTILSFYNNIPLDSKRFARGDYDPIGYTIEWVYRSTQETDISNRYQFDSGLNLNIRNQAFYPYTFSTDSLNQISDVVYVDYPSGAVDPQFKYLTTLASQNITFSEENDDVNWFDWVGNPGTDYTSFFTTGYEVHGGGFRYWAPMYLEMYSRNTVPTSYSYQGIWDFSINPNSGKQSQIETVMNFSPNFGMIRRRHKVRGRGKVFQFTISSVSGKPFDIMGWASIEEANRGE